MESNNNTPETIDELYIIAGKILHKSQQMEHSLAYLLMFMKVKDSGEWTKTTTEEIYDIYSQKTMGSNIYQMFKILNLDESRQDQLKRALRERNYVIHDLFNDGLGTFLTKSGRRKLIQKALNSLDKMRVGNELLTELVFLSVEENGFQKQFEETRISSNKMLELD